MKPLAAWKIVLAVAFALVIGWCAVWCGVALGEMTKGVWL